MEALYRDITIYHETNPQVTLGQYIDDLPAETEADRLRGTKQLLTELSKLDYWASAKKVQICQRKLSYLRYLLEHGRNWLSEARKNTILLVMPLRHPKMCENFWSFLLLVGFVFLGAKLASPLYSLTKAGQPLFWGKGERGLFWMHLSSGCLISGSSFICLWMRTEGWLTQS